MKRLLFCLALAGCTLDGAVEDERPDTCGASGYQSLIGQPIAAVTLPADLNMRIVGPGDIVTMEYDASRLNFETDEMGVIQRVTCG
ncbi:I78 family peptidase inhibitor [Thalassococcus sp. S3]|uniref:I78 family peptidase inhibitor n=1 Tax=Thalassococcus sp. S3 TaxID=2017482 RepID=UPI0010243B98|nr:I78 family peptidase inhibitor [Thalassococcus sp. S3]QBF30300.1 hypothetical protein CFI11_03585 [Thalassococcus sp. S3]